MHSKVAIIGGGPSGLLLSILLHQSGIDNLVLERRSKNQVLERIRAGVLEQGVVDQLEKAGVTKRLHTESYKHDGVVIFDGLNPFRIDFAQTSARSVFVYGQKEVTRDLYDRHAELGGKILFNVTDVVIHSVQSSQPTVTFKTQDQTPEQLNIDFVAGCDGFHGVSRRSIPDHLRRDFEKMFPYAWLGVLSATPPVHNELIYGASERGFALCSMRNENLSRYYIQCAVTDTADQWSDEAFWAELKLRIPPDHARKMITGPSLEKSVIPLRSFVTEPMQWGRLFLCGDAAHIVPPAGAKGLNSAILDVADLFEGLRQFYARGDETTLSGYSAKALLRVWKIVRFSLWFTQLTHRSPEQSAFDGRAQQGEVAELRTNALMQKLMSDNYVGLGR